MKTNCLKYKNKQTKEISEHGGKRNNADKYRQLRSVNQQRAEHRNNTGHNCRYSKHNPKPHRNNKIGYRNDYNTQTSSRRDGL